MQEEGGVRALYRGLVPTALGVAPYVGINFAAYEYVRRPHFLHVGLPLRSSLTTLCVQGFASVHHAAGQGVRTTQTRVWRAGRQHLANLDLPVRVRLVFWFHIVGALSADRSF